MPPCRHVDGTTGIMPADHRRPPDMISEIIPRDIGTDIAVVT